MEEAKIYSHIMSHCICLKTCPAIFQEAHPKNKSTKYNSEQKKNTRKHSNSNKQEALGAEHNVPDTYAKIPDLLRSRNNTA